VKFFTSSYFFAAMDDDKRLRKAPPAGGLSGADFAGVGLQFAAAIIVFLFVGQWLDGKFGTKGLFTIIGVFVGGGGAFYNMYRKITAAQRRDDEERKR
jgi:F0F1-type ATP synthase assembly protein I